MPIEPRRWSCPIVRTVLPAPRKFRSVREDFPRIALAARFHLAVSCRQRSSHAEETPLLTPLLNDETPLLNRGNLFPFLNEETPLLNEETPLLY